MLDLPVRRWFLPADPAEHPALDRATGPALDIGCGPGRHLIALAERGVFALGIDISPNMLDAARARGANVLERSVFDRVPGASRWRTALLLDGNIGIGGDPVALLSRVTELLAPDGRIIVEIEPRDVAHGCGGRPRRDGHRQRAHGFVGRPSGPLGSGHSPDRWAST